MVLEGGKRKEKGHFIHASGAVQILRAADSANSSSTAPVKGVQTLSNNQRCGNRSFKNTSVQDVNPGLRSRF
jgi:hypothetical protein